MSNVLTTASLSAAVVESLAWLSDHGFRYFKSYNHLRRKNPNGFSYIAVDTVRWNATAYNLAFYLGVQITEVETWISNLLGNPVKLSHYDRTIWNYTVNIGPTSPHWPFHLAGNWTIGAIEEFANVSGEISAFVCDLALPFVLEHQDPMAIRRTLIDTPGHATNQGYASILAIDCLYATPPQTESDIALLDRRHEQDAPGPRQKFDEFVAAVRLRMKSDQV